MIGYSNELYEDPSKLLVVGPPKIGKTEALCQLPNSALLDLQSGSRFIDKPEKIDVYGEMKKISKEDPETNMTPLKLLRQAIDFLSANRPDYLIVDTITDLEDMANQLAVLMYRKTQLGKNFKDTDITILPKGAGYGWLRNAYLELDSYLQNCYNKCIIYVVHPKTSSILKDGKELSARDINLTGKLKTIVAGEVDAIGYMYRDKSSNINMLSFKTQEQDLATGARPKHLANKEFVISEMSEDNVLTTNWGQIFTELT